MPVDPKIQKEIQEKIDGKYQDKSMHFWLNKVQYQIASMAEKLMPGESGAAAFGVAKGEFEDTQKPLFDKVGGLREDAGKFDYEGGDLEKKQEAYLKAKEMGQKFVDKVNSLDGTAAEFKPYFLALANVLNEKGNYTEAMMDNPYLARLDPLMTAGGPVFKMKDGQIDFDATKEAMGETFVPLMAMYGHYHALFQLEYEKQEFEKNGWTPEAYEQYVEKLANAMEGIVDNYNKLKDIAIKNPGKYNTDVLNNKLEDMVLDVPGQTRNIDVVVKQFMGEYSALQNGWDVTELNVMDSLAEIGFRLSKAVAENEAKYKIYTEAGKKIDALNERIAGADKEVKDKEKEIRNNAREQFKLSQEYNDFIAKALDENQELKALKEGLKNDREELKRVQDTERTPYMYTSDIKTDLDSLVKNYVDIERICRGKQVRTDEDRLDIIELMEEFINESNNKKYAPNKRMENIFAPLLPSLQETKKKVELRIALAEEGPESISDEVEQLRIRVKNVNNADKEEYNAIIADLANLNTRREAVSKKYEEQGIYDERATAQREKTLLDRIQNFILAREAEVAEQLNAARAEFPPQFRDLPREKQREYENKFIGVNPRVIPDIYVSEREDKIAEYMEQHGKGKEYDIILAMKKAQKKLEKIHDIDSNIVISNVRKAQNPEWTPKLSLNEFVYPDEEAESYYRKIKEEEKRKKEQKDDDDDDDDDDILVEDEKKRISYNNWQNEIKNENKKDLILGDDESESEEKENEKKNENKTENDNKNENENEHDLNQIFSDENQDRKSILSDRNNSFIGNINLGENNILDLSGEEEEIIQPANENNKKSSEENKSAKEQNDVPVLDPIRAINDLISEEIMNRSNKLFAYKDHSIDYDTFKKEFVQSVKKSLYLQALLNKYNKANAENPDAIEKNKEILTKAITSKDSDLALDYIMESDFGTALVKKLLSDYQGTKADLTHAKFVQTVEDTLRANKSDDTCVIAQSLGFDTFVKNGKEPVYDDDNDYELKTGFENKRYPGFNYYFDDYQEFNDYFAFFSVYGPLYNYGNVIAEKNTVNGTPNRTAQNATTLNERLTSTLEEAQRFNENKITGVIGSDAKFSPETARRAKSLVKEYIGFINKNLDSLVPKEGSFRKMADDEIFMFNPSNGDRMRMQLENPVMGSLLATYNIRPKILNYSETEMRNIMGKPLADALFAYHGSIAKLVKLQYERQKEVDNGTAELTEKKYKAKYIKAAKEYVDNYKKLVEEHRKVYAGAAKDEFREFKDVLEDDLSCITELHPRASLRNRTSVAAKEFEAQIKAAENGWASNELGLIGFLGATKAFHETIMQRELTKEVSSKTYEVNLAIQEKQAAEAEKNAEKIKKADEELKTAQAKLKAAQDKLEAANEFAEEFKVLYDKFYDKKVSNRYEKAEIAREIKEFVESHPVDFYTREADAASVKRHAENIYDPYCYEGRGRDKQLDMIMKELVAVDPALMKSSPEFKELRANVEALKKLSESLPGELNEEQHDKYVEQINKVKKSAKKYASMKKKEEDDYKKKNGKALNRKDSTKKRISFANSLADKLSAHLMASVKGDLGLLYKGNAEEHAVAKYALVQKNLERKRQNLFAQDVYTTENENLDADRLENFYRAAYVETMMIKHKTDPDFGPKQLSEALEEKNIKKGAQILRNKLEVYGFNEHLWEVTRNKDDLIDADEEFVDEDSYKEMKSSDADIVSEDGYKTIIEKSKGIGLDWIRFELRYAASLIASKEKNAKVRNEKIDSFGFDYKNGKVDRKASLKGKDYYDTEVYQDEEIDLDDLNEDELQERKEWLLENRPHFGKPDPDPGTKELISGKIKAFEGGVSDIEKTARKFGVGELESVSEEEKIKDIYTKLQNETENELLEINKRLNTFEYERTMTEKFNSLEPGDVIIVRTKETGVSATKRIEVLGIEDGVIFFDYHGQNYDLTGPGKGEKIPEVLDKGGISIKDLVGLKAEVLEDYSESFKNGEEELVSRPVSAFTIRERNYFFRLDKQIKKEIADIEKKGKGKIYSFENRAKKEYDLKRRNLTNKMGLNEETIYQRIFEEDKKKYEEYLVQKAKYDKFMSNFKEDITAEELAELKPQMEAVGLWVEKPKEVKEPMLYDDYLAKGKAEIEQETKEKILAIGKKVKNEIDRFDIEPRLAKAKEKYELAEQKRIEAEEKRRQILEDYKAQNPDKYANGEEPELDVFEEYALFERGEYASPESGMESKPSEKFSGKFSGKFEEETPEFDDNMSMDDYLDDDDLDYMLENGGFKEKQVDKEELLDNAYKGLYGEILQSEYLNNRKNKDELKAGLKAYDDPATANKFKAEIAKYPDYKEAFENKILEEKPANTYEVGKINDSIIANLKAEAEMSEDNKLIKETKEIINKFGVNKKNINKEADKMLQENNKIQKKNTNLLM